MANKREEYKERIEIAEELYKRYRRDLEKEFPILKEMSDEKAIRLIAKIVKGVIRRWSEWKKEEEQIQYRLEK